MNNNSFIKVEQLGQYLFIWNSLRNANDKTKDIANWGNKQPVWLSGAFQRSHKMYPNALEEN